MANVVEFYLICIVYQPVSSSVGDLSMTIFVQFNYIVNFLIDLKSFLNVLQISPLSYIF